MELQIVAKARGPKGWNKSGMESCKLRYSFNGVGKPGVGRGTMECFVDRLQNER